MNIKYLEVKTICITIFRTNLLKSKGKEMRNRTKFLSMILIFIISLSSTASAGEITVDDDYGANYTSIQEAVNNSTSGDTIIVRPGTYTENVIVNTTGITIRSESNNSDAQVKPLNESVSTFLIQADNITISGLKITGAGNNYDKDAIFVYSDMNNLTGNTIENGSIVLGSYTPDNSTTIFRGEMNNVTGNTIENGSITLYAEVLGNLIAENKISNSEEGVHISCCGMNTNIVSDNTISNCSTGIYEYDQGADIRNNTITDCSYGIVLSASTSGEIDNNTILNCDRGIVLGEACSSDIINNTIKSCAECGIYDMDGNSSKLIYNNYFNNTLNVRFEGAESTSTWNSSLTTGTNIVGGPYIGGNYWAKPDGTGFSQTSLDLDGNGIGDLPYNVYENDYDYLPLVLQSSSVTPTANFTANVTYGTAPLSVQFTDSSENETGWNWNFGDGATSNEQDPVHTYLSAGNYTVNLTVNNSNGSDSKLSAITVSENKGPVLPVADFSSNVTSGYVPFTVKFTDLSQNATGWNWDFGDGTSLTEQNPAHTYSAAGSYVVNLTSSNANGASSKTATITAQESDSDDDSDSSGGSSHSSSGGGGGGGGSPEPAKNVKVKELAQVFITNGKAVKFDFTKNATAVVNLSFDPKKTVGKTTTTIEMLKNRSTLTPVAPEHEVYNYLNIWVGNGGYGSDENNLGNAAICFRVEKSWMQDKKVDQSSIILNRYNNKTWNELPTSYLKEDSKYLYFTSKTPGFSPFAITGQAKITGNNTPAAVDNTQNNAENTKENMEQTPENTPGSNTSGEGSFNTSDYLRAFVIVCLLCVMGVFMFKMK
jgi:PGF-pre-PGF domain-containing protein